jgi:hypothetical protein
MALLLGKLSNGETWELTDTGAVRKSIHGHTLAEYTAAQLRVKLIAAKVRGHLLASINDYTTDEQVARRLIARRLTWVANMPE